MTAPFVTVVIPALNERNYIIPTIEELLSGAEDSVHELIVADGGSTDGTQDLVGKFAENHPSVRLIDNPARIQSAAVNLASRLADPRSTVLVRADAHCSYPRGFVAKIVQALSDNDAQSVVVPMFTVGEEGTYQESVALAQNSKFGNGGSSHRSGTSPSGWVDHGHHAAFDLRFFRSLGGYDESFQTNEDAEYDARVARSAGRIWMARDAEINYYPRRTPRSLAKQYFGYGRGRAATMLKHRMRPKPRQMAPLVIFCTMLASVAALTACDYSILPVAAYLALCAFYAARVSRGTRILSTASAFVIMHNAWGAGFITGFTRNLVCRRKDRG
jgi:succinoglycan biosynthesis protein ExoA